MTPFRLHAKGLLAAAARFKESLGAVPHAWPAGPLKKSLLAISYALLAGSLKWSLVAVSHAWLACSLACAPAKPLSPWAASERAAALANEKCQERYGARPFAAGDFEAVMEGGRWTWGAAGVRPIDGYAVEVSFEPDGGNPAVQVHRDEHLGNPEGL